MERQRVKDEIGALEERLELLDQVACENRSSRVASAQYSAEVLLQEALESLRRLQGLVQEEKLERSLDAEDFLRRVTSLLVRESHEAGFELAVATYGIGRISMEMVEVSMGAILSCLRASLKSFKGMGRAIRMKHRLFTPFSIYLEVRATPDEVHFRLIDDGQGYNGSFRTEFETEHQFRRIRSHISRYGGWFRRRSLPEFGGTIEFKASLPMSRFEALRLKSGNVEILLPNSCVAEVVNRVGLPSQKVAFLDLENGITLDAPPAMLASAVKVAVADFQFWVVCESATPATRARRISAEGMLERGAWFSGFGVFHEAGIPCILPLIDGETLMKFHLEAWGADESV